MKEINSNEEFAKALDDNNNIYIFSADWCPDCTVLYPIYDELEKSYPQFNFYKINLDELKDLSRSQKVLGIPVFIKYDDRKETRRIGSGERLSTDVIKAFLDSFN